MATVDIVVFVVFILAVVTLALWQSRTKAKRGKNAQDYFLAGRGLSWWLIGFSLIAANISTEQFVGMSGNAASHVGLAIASYEWMAAITLVVVAFAFLPYFLRVGIYTMPEFLEYRFNRWARLFMASATVLIYMLLLAAVTYSGALTMSTFFGDMGFETGLYTGSFFIALIAMVYVVVGGLKASVWADLIQGSALVVGGALILYFSFSMLGSAEEAASVVDVRTGEVVVQHLDENKGSVERFMDLNSNRLNMFLPKEDTVLPWTALLLGLWIPNFYYWGLNQYITQRTLGASSLAEGQKGIVFSAFLKLVIPFVVVIPGIIAFNLFYEDMQLKAQGDVGKAMGMYLKANSQTRFVELVQNVDQLAVDEHRGPTYLIAAYDSAAGMAGLKQGNPFVLPMLRSEFDGLAVSEYQIFGAQEDHAWRYVNPELAVEIASYNAKTESAARCAGATANSQALISYKYDTALGLLLGSVLPRNVGILGFVLAALLGAVVSSLAAMLNAASTIFTMDICNNYFLKNPSQRLIVLLGRISVVVFAAIAFFLAPQLGNPNLSNSIFTIIQESQGFISPGILAVFVVGLVLRRAPRSAGIVGLLTSVASYGGLKLIAPSIQFLNRMAICFALCVVVMLIMTAAKPLAQAVKFEAQTSLRLEASGGAKVAGFICILLTLALYIIFSPLVIAG